MMNSMPGKAVWADLTIGKTEKVRDFYKEVIGWQHTDIRVDESSAYVMSTPGGELTAGICEPVDESAGLPPIWFIYFSVEDLSASLDICRKLGGKVIYGPKGEGKSRYAVIEDPAGAVCALSQI